MRFAYLSVIASMLFQSCSVYSETSFTLSEAQNQGRVKVVDFANRPFQYDNIELSDSIYYGVNKKSKSRLDQKSLTGIYLRDDKSSKRTTILGILIPAGIVYLIIGFNEMKP